MSTAVASREVLIHCQLSSQKCLGIHLHIIHHIIQIALHAVENKQKLTRAVSNSANTNKHARHCSVRNSPTFRGTHHTEKYVLLGIPGSQQHTEAFQLPDKTR